MTQRFIQISDPHLSSLEGVRFHQLLSKRLLGYLSWRRKRRFEHRLEVLDALLDDVAGLDLCQVLVTGDLTHIGLPGEFSQVRDWLPRLGSATDVAVIPGNHDSCVAAPWASTYALWQDYMASDKPAPGSRLFPSVRVRDDIAFIGLSTACPKPPLMATGTLDQAQLDALPALLESCRERGLFRVVYLHHSPVPGQEKWRKRLTNADAISTLIEQHGAELMLHGHGHRARRETLSSRDGEVPVLAVPSASALGLHGADVAGFNHYRVDRTDSGWSLRVRRRCYDRDAGSFMDGERTTIELTRGDTG